MSFPHRDFANPEAETCWLSCLFQALWHSVVFHSAFERDLVPEKYEPGQDENLLAALQETWADYKAEIKADDRGEPTESHGAAAAGPAGALVPADGLVSGFGEGYGDMSEALALLQSELSDSANPAAITLSERIVVLPLSVTEDVLPSPELAWKLAQEWQVGSASLIAVDITVPQLPAESIEGLAQLWVPGKKAAAEQENVVQENALANLQTEAEKGATGSLGGTGSSHQIVALVCYMHHLQHYVAFCRRQSNPDRCCFFNDLPELTKGLPKEVEWQRVPAVCKEYSLTPRLVLFESTDTMQ